MPLPPGSDASIGSIPARRSRVPFQWAVTPMPAGETTPMPLMTSEAGSVM
jgi:hypothetical protein